MRGIESVTNVFSRRLKTLREMKGLKQSELAGMLGVSRGSISFYENADRTPDIEFLYRVSDYFGVSYDWLIGLGNESRKEPTITDLTGLSEKALESIRNMDRDTLAGLNTLLEGIG